MSLLLLMPLEDRSGVAALCAHMVILAIITSIRAESEHNERPIGPVDPDALKAGDEAAWDEAFRYFWPIALAAARRTAPHLSESLREEIASDAILKCIWQIDQITSFAHAEAFVRVAAGRGAISIARKESADKRSPPANPDSAAGPVGAEGLTDMERCELIVFLGRILDGLEPMARLCLLERANGFTSQEISKRYGLPLGTVCTKVARGLAAARAELRKDPSVMKELRSYLR